MDVHDALGLRWAVEVWGGGAGGAPRRLTRATLSSMLFYVTTRKRIGFAVPYFRSAISSARFAGSLSIAEQ